MRVVFLASFAFVCCLIAGSYRLRKVPGRPTGRCGNCRYDLAGLSAGPCPECGGFDLERSPPSHHIVFRRHAGRTAFRSAAAWLVIIFIITPLADIPLMLEYRAQGISFEQAKMAIPVRRASNLDPDGSAPLAPLLFATALSPLALRSHPRRRRRNFALTLAVGGLTTFGLLALQLLASR